MSRQAVIALDVGGTTIDSACVSVDGELIGCLRESGSPAAGAGLPSVPVIPAAPGNMAIWGAARHAFTAGSGAAP